jgi:hypothetical protein
MKNGKSRVSPPAILVLLLGLAVSCNQSADDDGDAGRDGGRECLWYELCSYPDLNYCRENFTYCPTSGHCCLVGYPHYCSETTATGGLCYTGDPR